MGAAAPSVVGRAAALPVVKGKKREKRKRGGEGESE
jgi:hypothetical protein